MYDGPLENQGEAKGRAYNLDKKYFWKSVQSSKYGQNMHFINGRAH